eukprot:gnl/TRDRNA2_/TRDRNA2_36296_c0_seq2.p1 gnl/TRDRNA2_/TRDRNA2_36296_c0~~gnl/TRDRNA2_/TRDRNA2_36296_c0_seq2.p1  ORF type:complete len:250 (-),score=27.60 gnl/TRDRNA2_/TRDRNA2_36296_c0_seq2:62-811(-)
MQCAALQSAPRSGRHVDVLFIQRPSRLPGRCHFDATEPLPARLAQVMSPESWAVLALQLSRHVGRLWPFWPICVPMVLSIVFLAACGVWQETHRSTLPAEAWRLIRVLEATAASSCTMLGFVAGQNVLSWRNRRVDGDIDDLIRKASMQLAPHGVRLDYRTLNTGFPCCKPWKLQTWRALLILDLTELRHQDWDGDTAVPGKSAFEEEDLEPLMLESLETRQCASDPGVMCGDERVTEHYDRTIGRCSS